MKARRLAAQATMAAKSPAEKAERAAKISKGLKEVWAEYGLQIEAKRSATRAAPTPEQVAQLSQTLSTAQKGYHSKRREERALMSKYEYGATKLRRGKYTQERIDKVQASHAARPSEERAESLARGVLKSQAQKAVKMLLSPHYHLMGSRRSRRRRNVKGLQSGRRERLTSPSNNRKNSLQRRRLHAPGWRNINRSEEVRCTMHTWLR